MNRFILTFLGVGLAFVQPALQAQAPAKPAGPIIITNGPAVTENGKPRANTPYLSNGVSDIIRMFQAGVEEPVILAFIQSSTVPYHPSAREVIYLREVGLPQSVITAMLKRGGELRDRAAEADREERARAPQPAPAPAQSPPASPPASTTTPDAQAAGYPAPYVAPYPYVSYPAYTYAAYSYGYPAYGYGYYGYGGCRPYYPYYYGNCYRGYGNCYGGYYRGYGGYYGGYGGYCGGARVGVGFYGPNFAVGVGYRANGGYGGGIHYTGGYGGGRGGGIHYTGGRAGGGGGVHYATMRHR